MIRSMTRRNAERAMTQLRLPRQEVRRIVPTMTGDSR
jgi:hypothetical protein